MNAHIAAFLQAYCTLVPCVTGDPKFSEVMLCDFRKFPGKSSPYLLFLSLHDGEVLDKSLPFSTTSFPL